MTKEKMFPVLDFDGDIPWRLIEPHREHAWFRHDQTLERLAERGGLSPSEVLILMFKDSIDGIIDGDINDKIDAEELLRTVSNHDIALQKHYKETTGKKKFLISWEMFGEHPEKIVWAHTLEEAHDMAHEAAVKDFSEIVLYGAEEIIEV